MCVKGPRQRMSASDLTKHDFVDKAKVPDKNKKCAHLDLTPMMSAAEAASIANAWATYAANALARTADNEELANTNQGLMSDSERGLVRKLTKSEVFKSKETASFMDSLSHDSLSSNKMAALSKNIGCEHPS